MVNKFNILYLVSNYKTITIADILDHCEKFGTTSTLELINLLIKFLLTTIESEKEGAQTIDDLCDQVNLIKWNDNDKT